MRKICGIEQTGVKATSYGE